jgi:hypothetical protein
MLLSWSPSKRAVHKNRGFKGGYFDSVIVNARHQAIDATLLFLERNPTQSGELEGKASPQPQ